VNKNAEISVFYFNVILISRDEINSSAVHVNKRIATTLENLRDTVYPPYTQFLNFKYLKRLQQ